MKFSKFELARASILAVYDCLRDPRIRGMMMVLFSPIPIIASGVLIWLSTFSRSWDMASLAWLLLMAGLLMTIHGARKAAGR
jgi:hypothetical protein